MSMPGSGAGGLQMSLTMNMSSFGVAVDLEPPPASKTVELTSQVESKKTSE